jgi:hypothetical protein
MSLQGVVSVTGGQIIVAVAAIKEIPAFPAIKYIVSITVSQDVVTVAAV